jgi:hypothetical protein
LIDTFIRHDHANDGKSGKEVVDLILQLEPDLSQKQASQAFHHTVFPRHLGPGGIKQKQ